VLYRLLKIISHGTVSSENFFLGHFPLATSSVALGVVKNFVCRNVGENKVQKKFLNSVQNAAFCFALQSVVKNNTVCIQQRITTFYQNLAARQSCVFVVNRG
jgi:low temperature requirement protein LtrA